MFDLRRPDAEPDFFMESGASLAHEGTVKSVVWVGEHTGVTAGEDGVIKYVMSILHGLNQFNHTHSQVVGSPYTDPDH